MVNKTIKAVVAALITVISVSQVQAYNKRVIFSPTVQSYYPIVRYGHTQKWGPYHEFKEQSGFLPDFEYHDYPAAIVPEINWEVGGTCISAYDIFIIEGGWEGQFRNEYIGRDFNGKFQPGIFSADGNHCRAHTMYLGTPEEVAKYAIGKTGTVYKSSGGKLALFID